MDGRKAPADPPRFEPDPTDGAGDPSRPGPPRRLFAAIAQVLAVGGLAGLPARAADIVVDDPSGGSGGTGCTLRDALTAANTDAGVAGCAAGAGFDRVFLPAGATIQFGGPDNGDNCLPVISSSVSLLGRDTVLRGPVVGPGCRVLDVAGVGSTSVILEGLRVEGGRVDGLGDGGGVRVASAGLTLVDTVVTGNRAENGGGVSLGNGVLVMQDSELSGNLAVGAGGGLSTINPAFVYAYSSRFTGNQAGSGGGASLHGGGRRNPGPDLADGRLARWLTQGQRVVERAPLGGSYGSFLMDCTISGNTAGIGGGPAPRGGSAGAGGGIALGQGIAYLEASRVESNLAGGDGGGIAADSGAVVLLESVISGNSATGQGGGVSLAGAYQIAVNATVSDNEAASGGGMAAVDSYNVLFKTTLSGNRALSAAPGGGEGGALFGDGSILLLQTSTLSGNRARADGSAMSWSKYTLTIPRGPAGATAGSRGSKYLVDVRQSTIAFNTLAEPGGGGRAITVAVGLNSGLMNSIVHNPGAPECRALTGGDPANVRSLVRDGSCNAVLRGDPRLRPLAVSGGLTATHGLQPGSPAVAAGDPGLCAMAPTGSDQNGQPIPGGGAPCSIGSTQGAVSGPGAPAVPVPALNTAGRWLAVLSILVGAGLRIGRRPDRETLEP